VVIPPGVDCKTVKSVQPSLVSVFMISALEWQPNVEGLEWFLKQVWPKVHKKCPDLEFHIAGKRTPEHILNLKLKNVKVHGFVPDATEFMRKYGLMLVPLFSGSGTRIKILEGMAAGKPIVSTTIGAEGMDYQKGENILIADSVEEWTKVIIDYYNNSSNYNAIGNNGKEWVMKNYSIEESTKRLIHLYQGLL
jgi:glycosyltransferase involved in cell wall biosynthesis